MGYCGRWADIQRHLMNTINNHKKCALCLCEKQLIQSHIVPEGFYKFQYDRIGRTVYSSPSQNVCKYIQKGLREVLLCRKCDGNIIGKYDKYGIEVIRDGKHFTKQIFTDSEIWHGLDYKTFTLFHLSVLWRSHLASINSRGVQLDNTRAELIRIALLTGANSGEYQFPIFGYILCHTSGDNSCCQEIIHLGNTYTIDNGAEVAVVVFGGVSWNYYLKESSKSDKYAPIFLGLDGSMIMQYENVYDHKPIMDHMPAIRAVSDRSIRRNVQGGAPDTLTGAGAL